MQTVRGLLLFVVAVAGCGMPPATEDEALAGGETTVFDEGRNAFSLAARNLKGERRDAFFVGNSFFNRGWVAAPSSTTGVDGLGPTFNANSCSSCHFKDGRGAPPQASEEFEGLLIRLSIPGQDAHGGGVDEPNYGGQFNHRAVLGVPAEGKSHVTYTEEAGAFPDGESYSLRHPQYTFTDLAFGAMSADVMLSPRTAPSMVGLGLLEAITEADLLALVDADDRDGDGISGRDNRVWDKKSQSLQLGRFGWKANQPSLEQQNSGAFLGDIGITSPLFPADNCPAAQTLCATAPSGGSPEIDQDKIDDVTYYSHLLAVPARRNLEDADARVGQSLFKQIGCASCHTPRFRTGTLENFSELSAQIIFPYSDLLLHDLGDALADNRPDFLATGREWRTPPLWGIGLIPVVNQHHNFMHDGRARSLTEAILWHGGEAEAAREAFKQLPRPERAQLVRFLESL